jgi:ribosomal protein S18 acetylase RimI-like enzyme
MEEYTIRKASHTDIPFLVEAIIQAEKSNTDKLGLATLFELTEDEVRTYVADILAEEIDGCEFSVSSFLIAETNGFAVATAGGWIEGENNKSSAMLKASLLPYIIPIEKIENIIPKSAIINGVQIEREQGTYQIEYVFVDKNHRGNNLAAKIIAMHISGCKQRNAEIKKIHIQVFDNNPAAVVAYEKAGFTLLSKHESFDDRILELLPGKTKLLLQKTI